MKRLAKWLAWLFGGGPTVTAAEMLPLYLRGDGTSYRHDQEAA